MPDEDTLLNAPHREAENDAAHAAIVRDFEAVFRLVYLVLDRARRNARRSPARYTTSPCGSATTR